MRQLTLFLTLIVFVSCSKEVDYPAIAYLELPSTTLVIEEIQAGLDTPWDIDASVPGKLYYTEQNGKVYVKDLETGTSSLLLNIPDVFYQKSYGLLGMTVHPDKDYLYLHHTYLANGDPMSPRIRSRILRYDIHSDTLLNQKIILDEIPGNTYHNGSRLIISPNDKLFFSMGDAGRANQTQSDDILVGKIMRFELDGSVPVDNPIEGSPIWSRGHRNPQGLAFSTDGLFYSTEHGPNNDDEINLIQKDGNYGWPDVQGFCDEDWEQNFCEENQINEPLKAWTPTIAVAGMAYLNDKAPVEWNNSLIIANMKGRAMRVLNLSKDGLEITSEQIYFQKYFGRIRDISVSPEGDIFFSTTNTDWHPRFQPWMYDQLPQGKDRIIRMRSLAENEIVRSDLPVLKEDDKAIDLLSENWNYQVVSEEYETGQKIYTQQCMVCHGPNGKGSEGMFPPLASSEWVNDKGKLMRTVLAGLSGEIEVNGETYNQEMPGFARLTDQELAELLTYIRNSFGNKGSAVIAGEVYEERQSLIRQGKLN